MKRLSGSIRVGFWVLVSGILLWSLFPTPATAVSTEVLRAYFLGNISKPEPVEILFRDVLAKARPDECFYGIFSSDPESPWYDPDHPNNPENPNIYDPSLQESCPHNKVNQAYVWGLAKSGDDIWFGTAPNTHCLVLGGYLGVTDPILTDSCLRVRGNPVQSERLRTPCCNRRLATASHFRL